VLITGITGQDGGYLTERLLSEGLQVHGLVQAHDEIAAVLRAAHPSVILHDGDLSDDALLRRLVVEIEPDELYNLAGLSSVAFSWEEPILTAQLNGVAAAVLFQAAFQLQERTGRRIACVQASSSEIFGVARDFPQDESTPVRPVSPYGAAKAYAHHMAGVYRSKGLHVTSCILFNHESPRRPETFVTRKITVAAARIGIEGTGVLRLGNLEARRDWGWAPDYVDAMIRAARYERGGDFVIATGRTHTVEEFAEAALRHAGVGDAWRDHIEVDPGLLRPMDTAVMVGNAAKARQELGWTPTVDFGDIVGRMVDHDMSLLRGGR
jgi:GDPmannose 4,6-dehydratase